MEFHLAATHGEAEHGPIPSEDRGERRTAFVGFQVTPAERAELERRAAKAGRSLSDFARIVLLSDLKDPAPAERDPEALRALAFQLSKIGTNLNQLAKVANERRALPREAEFRSVADQVVQTLDRVLAL